MKRFVVRGLSVFAALILSVSCQLLSNDKDDEKKNTELALVALALQVEGMEINGSWDDGWAYHSISAQRFMDGRVEGHWNSDSLHQAPAVGAGYDPGTIVEFSNGARTAYIVTGVPSWCTGNGAAYPGCGPCYDTQKCYNRNVWTRYNGEWYYCTTVFNKDSLSAAKADTATADATNPVATGCGGSFAWTKLTRR